MRVAVVVQRYGADINGGAELHARYIAEHLSHHVEVEVLTTCATDYVTWRNELPQGLDRVGGVTVRRFPVRRERDIDDFGKRSLRVFAHPHSVTDELRWLESEGPTSPALIDHIRQSHKSWDYFIFFTYRYYQTYHGLRTVNSRALLVPTAERDAAIGVSLFGSVFRGARAIMYNSLEERALIQEVAGNLDVPGDVVGVGSEVPPTADPLRFRRKFGIDSRFAVYVGRIDENKGCKEMFEFFARYAAVHPRGVSLVLLGRSIMRVPSSQRIHHLGFVSDQDKFDAIAAADLLIMPSYYESLSMVSLEAWSLGRPILANGHRDVLRGQCIRSNGGLYYESYEEFAEALRLLERDRHLNAVLGQNGQAYFRRHYAWPVVERKYLKMLDRLQREDAAGAPRRPIEPLPGWFARRKASLPPAEQIVAAVPRGPVAPEPSMPSSA